MYAPNSRYSICDEKKDAFQKGTRVKQLRLTTHPCNKAVNIYLSKLPFFGHIDHKAVIVPVPRHIDAKSTSPPGKQPKGNLDSRQNPSFRQGRHKEGSGNGPVNIAKPSRERRPSTHNVPTPRDRKQMSLWGILPYGPTWGDKGLHQGNSRPTGKLMALGKRNKPSSDRSKDNCTG